MFFGMGVSWIGTWMQNVAMSWLVYELTGSPFILGLVGFASQFPAFVVAPLAGVLADRWSKMRIALVTQSLAMLQASVLAALILTGTVQVWHIVALTTCLGFISGFDVPARQALLIELVEGPQDLANGIALNSSLFNGARLVGPAIAGVLISIMDEGWVVLINALSYIAILAALVAIGVPPRRKVIGTTSKAINRNFSEGLRYVAGFTPIRTLLTLLAVTSLVAMPFTVLLPVFATEILDGGADTLGFMMSATGFGALAGALFLASRASVRGLSQIIVTTTSLFGIGLVAFSFSRSEPLSVALLLFAGFGMMTTTAASNTILQTIVDPDKRGRVMSLYAMAFMGMTPFGALIAGALAGRIGAPNTVLIGGIACLLTAGWFASRRGAFRREVRPIYIRLGILPEVADAIQTATDRPRT